MKRKCCRACVVRVKTCAFKLWSKSKCRKVNPARAIEMMATTAARVFFKGDLSSVIDLKRGDERYSVAKKDMASVMLSRNIERCSEYPYTSTSTREST